MSEDTKNKLIESTLSLYLQGGLAAVSMRKVASNAGLSTMASYRHFKNKEHLLNEMLIEGFKRLQGYFAKARAIENPAESLKQCMNLYLEFAQGQPQFYEMMFLGRLRTEDPQLEQRCQQQFKVALMFLSERVKQCIDQGYIKEQDLAPQSAEDFAFSLWSLCHGMTSLYLLGQLKDKDSFVKIYQQSLNNFYTQVGLN